MARTGAYEFRLAAKAVNGEVPGNGLYLHELVEPGEWAWINLRSVGGNGWDLIIRCPDCGCFGTLWRIDRGHDIDAQGNISPSVLETCQHNCGFHTMPTKLLGFMDKRLNAP
jgi:hypothetical protein